ncbi:hypothetical protein DDZ14_04845 [Maritimibacter sp. 55A14]|uniref:hypothetical protein n=1 Tax=Maritimibacter sp. 55A14 TaxID=2174844 RepID=UPI000D61CE70|nr:hypothetical protein [Maritimibacter sp. 55A14]PWE33521.1 hypothetical protein DDZ14_04845 [Maritimibacter sp. 55A14]
MRVQTKIATCCYCGQRTVLELGRERHQLQCAGCGAPITRMKPLKVDSGRGVHPVKRGRAERRYVPNGYPREMPPRPRKRRGLLYYLREAFDEIEDIFD